MASTRRQFLMRTAVFGGAALTRPSGVAAGDQSAGAPVANAFDYKRNWGRWGNDDQMGAANLITASKRAASAALVKTGRAVSLSRVFTPPQHYIRINADRGSVVDYYGFEYHGVTITHLDALSHMWDRNGMWNGRDPAKEIDTSGVRFGDITAFGDGLITRGVLLDVPRHRGTSHVVPGEPVTGAELEAIAKARGVTIEPGDALVIHCGREAYQRTGQHVRRRDRRSSGPACVLRAVHPRPRRRGPRVGHARRAPGSRWAPMAGSRRAVQLWRAARRQCAAGAAVAGMRGRAARRVHVHGPPAQSGAWHG